MSTLPAKIAIVGGHRETFFDAPYHDGITEIWGFNSSARLMERIDRAFQIHDKWYIAETHNKAYRLWLRSCGIPVYTKEKYDDIPSSVAYPYKEVYELTKHVRLRFKQLRYFTSSFPFALALAIIENRPKISLYGIELSAGTEYELQRECFTFWVGFAAGRGIELDINCADGIFNRPIYG